MMNSQQECQCWLYCTALWFSSLETMMDSKPHIETTSTKKVLIKTIETRDGQVQSTWSDFQSNESFTASIRSSGTQLIMFCLHPCPGDQRVNPEPRWLGVIMSLSLPNNQKQYGETQFTGATSKQPTTTHKEQTASESAFILRVMNP